MGAKQTQLARAHKPLLAQGEWLSWGPCALYLGASSHTRRPTMATDVLDILMRLVAAGFLGACIGFERRIHHKAIGIAGMVLIAIGSTTYMLLGRHLAELDPSSISRTLQGFLSGIGFLGGAVIFKSGLDVKGIKAAAAIWITGALGLAIATSYCRDESSNFAPRARERSF